MREYNNRDTKSNDAELDPCLAAEIRLKKSVVSPRARKGLVVLLALAVLAAVLCVLLFIIFSRSSSKKESLPEERSPEYHHFESAGEFATVSTQSPPYINFARVPSVSSIRNKFGEKEAGSHPKDDTDFLDDDFDDEKPVVAKPIFFAPQTSTTPSARRPSSRHPSNMATETSKLVSSTPSVVTSKPSTATTPRKHLSVATVVPLRLIPPFVGPAEDGRAPPSLMTSPSTKVKPIVTTVKPTVTAAAGTISPSPAALNVSSRSDGDKREVPSAGGSLPRFDSSETGEDCKSLYTKGKRGTGVYPLSLPSVGNFSALCDMNTDGGGWTVIQRRQSNGVRFWNRTWAEYEDGFGDITSSHWLGLKKIHALVSKERGRSLILRIELRGDFCNDSSKCSNLPHGFWWGEWNFKIGDASENYTLSISPAIGGNLTEHNNNDKFFYMNNDKPFTTVDRDNDRLAMANCAQFRYLGGWWHNDCGYVSLNGLYGDHSWKMRSMYWFYSNGSRASQSYYIKPRRSEMKVRPKQ